MSSEFSITEVLHALFSQPANVAIGSSILSTGNEHGDRPSGVGSESGRGQRSQLGYCNCDGSVSRRRNRGTFLFYLESFSGLDVFMVGFGEPGYWHGLPPAAHPSWI